MKNAVLSDDNAMDLLRMTDDDNEADAIIRGFARQGERIVPALLERVHSSDDRLYRRILLILQRIDRAVPHLERMLNGVPAEEQVSIITILERPKLRSAVPAIIRACYDPAEEVREAAIESLHTLRDRRGRHGVAHLLTPFTPPAPPSQGGEKTDLHALPKGGR